MDDNMYSTDNYMRFPKNMSPWSTKFGSWQPPIDWEIKSPFSTTGGTSALPGIAQGGIQPPCVLCAENEEEMVDGILEPKLHTEVRMNSCLSQQHRSSTSYWADEEIIPATGMAGGKGALAF